MPYTQRNPTSASTPLSDVQAIDSYLGTTLPTEQAAKADASVVTAHQAATAAHGATGAVVGTTNAQTLTNKTLTAPAITAPTGIVKADVGLANVPNVDATARANHTGTQSADTLTDGTTNVAYLATERTKLAAVAASADVTATALAPASHAATSKATPVDADEIPLVDSAATFGLKKLTWANLKATVKTYTDTLYAALVHTHAGTDIASGTVPTARLGSGTASATTFLRGDQTWGTPAGGTTTLKTILGWRDMMDFGAAGNGTSDDSAAFAAALADIPSNQGGAIYFNPTKKFAGNFTVNRDNIQLIGDSSDPRGATNSVLVPYDVTKPVITLGSAARTDTFSGVRLDGITLDAAGPNGQGQYGLSILSGSINQRHGVVGLRSFTTSALKMANTAAGTITLIWFDFLQVEGPTTGTAVAGGAQIDITHTTGGAGYLTAIYFDKLHVTGNPWTNTHYCLRTDGAVVSFAQSYFDMFTGRGIKLLRSGSVSPYLVCDDVQFDSSTSTDVLVEVYDSPTPLKVPNYIHGHFHLDGLLRSADGATTVDATQLGDGNFGYGNQLDNSLVTGSLYFSPDGNAATAHRAYADSSWLNFIGPNVLFSPAGGIVNTYVGGSASPDIKLTNDNSNVEIVGVIPASGPRYFEFRVAGTARGRIGEGTGLLYANTAAGSAIANTTTETAVLTGYSMAANEMRSGQALRVRSSGTIANGATTPTITYKVKYGTNIIAASPAISLLASLPAGSEWFLDCDLVVTAVGASATVEAFGTVSVVNSVTSGILATYQIKEPTTAPTAFSSAASGTLTVTAQWGTAAAANTLTGRTLTIQALN